MFSLHSQVKLKFSPSFVFAPVPKFFQTLFKIRISISPRRIRQAPLTRPSSPSRPVARSFLNELISLSNHARFLYMRPGDLTEYVNTTFNLYFLIIFSLIFLISLRVASASAASPSHHTYRSRGPSQLESRKTVHFNPL